MTLPPCKAALAQRKTGKRWNRNTDRDPWFPPARPFLDNRDPNPIYRQQAVEAKTACLACPVRAACAAEAIQLTVNGVWGGLDETDRRRIQTERGITPIDHRPDYRLFPGRVEKRAS